MCGKIKAVMILCFGLLLNTGYSLENKQNISCTARYQENLHIVQSSNEEISSISYKTLESGGRDGGIGVGYSYSGFSLDIITAMSFDNIESSFAFSNDTWVVRNCSRYRKGKQISINENEDRSNNLSSEDVNKTFSRAYSLGTTSSFGWIIPINIFFLKEFSYKSVFMQQKKLGDRTAIALIPAVVYDFSSLRSPDDLLPESEKEFYDNDESWKGDSIHTLEFDLGLGFVASSNNFYFATDIAISPIQYRKGFVKFGNECEVDELIVVPKISHFYFTLGHTDSSMFWLVKFGTEGYKEYSFADSNVSLKEQFSYIELKAGIRF